MDISHQQAISICQQINSRVNRVTKLAQNKITKKHEPHLRSLAAEQSRKFVKKTKVKSA